MMSLLLVHAVELPRRVDCTVNGVVRGPSTWMYKYMYLRQGSGENYLTSSIGVGR